MNKKIQQAANELSSNTSSRSNKIPKQDRYLTQNKSTKPITMWIYRVMDKETTYCIIKDHTRKLQ